MKDFNNLYDSSYFTNRKSNDRKRMLSFEQEKSFIEKYMPMTGCVCDVGCSTGEFLSAIGWQGPMYGMEVNDEAITLATTSGISFERNIQTEKEFFDIVIFRGTIQHLPEPFTYIGRAYDSLKKGGYIVFLATPNANSLVYKFFNHLPVLDARYNFYIPSDISLCHVLQNYGFEVVAIDRPYLKSPYSRPVTDHLQFVFSLITRKKPTFAFWGSMINLIAVKR